MLQMAGLGVAALAALVIAINAAFMMASPRRWFHLPGWVALRGSLREAKYGTGSGAIQVRLAGAVCLGGILWILYDILLGAG